MRAKFRIAFSFVTSDILELGKSECKEPDEENLLHLMSFSSIFSIGVGLDYVCMCATLVSLGHGSTSSK